MINNRQSGGRRRGRGGGGGGPPRSNNPGPGNRQDNRQRGNAAQLLEKYKGMARDAQMQGDRVLTETYLQYADHYFRVLAETRSRYEEQRPRQRVAPSAIVQALEQLQLHRGVARIIQRLDRFAPRRRSFLVRDLQEALERLVVRQMQ